MRGKIINFLIVILGIIVGAGTTYMVIANPFDSNKESGPTITLATHAKDIVNKMKKRVVTLDKGLIIKDTMKGNYISESD